MESDFGFDEYIMPTTYADAPKLESFDAQLYPSTTGYGYMGCDPAVMSLGTMPLAIPFHHPHQPQTPSGGIPTGLMTLDHQQFLPSSPAESVHSVHHQGRLSPPAATPPLVSCSPTSSSAPSMSPGGKPPAAASTAHAISEKIAQVSKLPESFLPEFHQYSKETYENGSSNSKKRRRTTQQQRSSSTSSSDETDENNNGGGTTGNNTSSSSEQEEDMDSISAAELRRQIHIQSEQKRRAQIKDGFDELRQHLPGCVNKKMSKAALLHRTVQHLQHLKSTQGALLAELERLVHENEQLRKFQESVLQKQALDRMYQMGAM